MRDSERRTVMQVYEEISKRLLNLGNFSELNEVNKIVYSELNWVRGLLEDTKEINP